MPKVFASPELDLQLVRELRELGRKGATVRELVAVIHAGLDLPSDAVIPVLWYLASAFDLSLREVLPVREWLGTENDTDIDALILPAIEQAKHRWASSG